MKIDILGVFNVFLMFSLPPPKLQVLQKLTPTLVCIELFDSQNKVNKLKIMCEKFIAIFHGNCVYGKEYI